MREKQTYDERLSSGRTEVLFLVLTALFLELALRRRRARRTEGGGRARIALAFYVLSAFFLFYTLNYRTLLIHLTPEALILRFGLFSWRVPMENIEHAALDEYSLWRIGGAGIHFSWFQGRYRAMFNFLEYPRVVVSLRQKQGPVKEIAFSSQHPETVLDFIRDHTDVRDVNVK